MENDLISRSELLGKFMAMLAFSSDRVVLIENVIEQIQNAPAVEQPQTRMKLNEKLFVVGNGDVITVNGEVVGHVNLTEVI